MVPQVGQRIGPYEILGRLGSGGMGLVYSAWDSRLQRDVAIKILREEYTSPGMRQRFLQEARAASRLNHANICTIFDIGEQEGDPYLVMELLKGDTIRARISRGMVSAEDLCTIATETADALIVAHGRGIIHRDIKPANIMLVEKAAGRFQTKVLDFGLAKVEHGEGGDTRIDLTSAGTTVGTVAYMSPEQARGEALDARSDLFSLGTVLYEMATGELPFQGATSALVFVQLLSQAPESLREFNPDIPKELEKIILKLLEKKRENRFQSAVEVVEAFSNVSLKRGGKGLFGSKQPAKSWGRDRDRSQDPPTLPMRRSVPGQAKGFEQRSVPRFDTSALMPPPAPTPAPNTPSIPAPPPADTGKSMQDSAEMFLRPVKRVLPGDSSQPAKGLSDPNVPVSNVPAVPKPIPPAKPEAHPSAFQLFQAASTAAHRTAGSNPELKNTPRASSGSIAASSILSGMHRPPARSSSGVMPVAAASTAPTESSKSFIPVLPTPPAEGNPTEKTSSGSHPSRLVSTRIPARKFSSPEVRYVEENLASAKPKSRGGLFAVLAFVSLAVAGYFGFRMFRGGTLQGNAPVSLLIVSLENHTGDSALKGVFQAGMLLDLQQSPHLSVRGRTDLLAGAKSVGVDINNTPSADDARNIARAVGANAIAFGSIDGGNGQYTVSMHITNASSGAVVKDASETAASREQVPDAIDRLSSDIRLALGESGDSVSAALIPLTRDASGNPDALAAYYTAEDLKASGKIDDAAASYERATTFDANFTQAYIELADIRRQQHAEVEAAAAAAHAQNAASNAGVGARTQKLAAALYALTNQGDATTAIASLQALCATYTADTESHVLLSIAQRLAGNYTDSLTTAQGVLAIAPYNDRALSNAELAMIALGRTSDAQEMESRSAKAGLPHPAIAAMLLLLTPETAPEASTTQAHTLATRITNATVLDAGGQFLAGSQAWQDVVQFAKSDPGTASSASYSIANEALDHALTNDCPTAQSLLQSGITLPGGPEAQYFAGIAYALCNNPQGAKLSQSQLTTSAKQFLVARKVLLPVLNAVLQWKSGDSNGALNGLQTSASDPQSESDSLWLAPYLQALIQLDQKHTDQAFSALDPLVNPNTVAKPVRIVYPLLYPMAELQAGRSADARNRLDAYKEFAKLWAKSDPGNALLAEAKTSSQ